MKMNRSLIKKEIPILCGAGSFLGADWEELAGKFFSNPVSLFEWTREAFPALDVLEKDDKIIVKAEIPGMDKRAIHVRLEDGTLTISGEKKSEEKSDKEGYYHVERAFGSFKRTVNLPKGIRCEEVNAFYKDGILTVDIPKSKEKAAKGKDLQIN